MGVCRPNWSDSCTQPPNPNPKKCKIVRAAQKNGYTILEVEYEGCTTFEGTKILVYAAPLKDIVQQKVEIGLDPHFSDKEGYLSPVARFKPDNGFDVACYLFFGCLYDGVVFAGHVPLEEECVRLEKLKKQYGFKLI